MIPTQVRIRAYIRLSKLHTAETEMPILKAEKKTARIPGSSASFEAGGPDYPEQMLYAAVPDRRDEEHPVVLYENTSRTGGQRGGGETSAGECTGHSQNIEGRMVPLSEPAEKRARFSALDRQMSLFAPKCRIFQQLDCHGNAV